VGKNKTPQYNPPPAPTLKTADELYGAATKYAQQNTPLALGARESALSDLSKGNDYYAGFQPTSFEQALGNQYFQNVWPGQEESIKHGLSLSGLDSSPILASMLGTQRGQTEFNIGDYLNQQGNNRANYSLSSRLAISPDSVIGGYLGTDLGQSNSQAQYNYDYQQQLAQAEYQRAVQKFNQQQALYKALGTVSPIGGAIYGGITGGSTGVGSSLGGTADLFKAFAGGMGGSMMGGGMGFGAASPVNPGSAGLASAVNPINYSMASSPYNPNQYFPGFGGRGGAV